MGFGFARLMLLSVTTTLRMPSLISTSVMTAMPPLTSMSATMRPTLSNLRRLETSRRQWMRPSQLLESSCKPMDVDCSSMGSIWSLSHTELVHSLV
jgi:hypothetical protein